MDLPTEAPLWTCRYGTMSVPLEPVSVLRTLPRLEVEGDSNAEKSAVAFTVEPSRAV